MVRCLLKQTQPQLQATGLSHTSLFIQDSYMKQITKEEFLLRATTKFGDKFNYSNVVYVSFKMPVEIMCNIHKVIIIKSPQHHLMGDGCCKSCANEKSVTTRSGKFKKQTPDELLVRFNDIYNNKYSYNFVRDKVNIMCPVHGGFSLTAKSHLAGNHCSKCTADEHQKRLKFNNPFSTEAGKRKIKETMLSKYGYDSPCKNPNIHAKQQRYKMKEYTFDTGEVIKYRGYELKAILDLINVYGYKLSEIQLTEKRGIKYGDRVYHPDIIIPNERRIIEVKSSYTYSVDYEKLGKVKPAVEEAGFTFECWIY